MSGGALLRVAFAGLLFIVHCMVWLQCKSLVLKAEAEPEEKALRKYTPPEGFSTDAGPTAYGIAFILYSLTMSTAMLREVRRHGRCACHHSRFMEVARQEKLREMDVDVEQWEQFQEMTKGQLVRCGYGWVLA